MAGEQPRRVVLPEVLPLQEDAREASAHAGHEGVDELVVLVTPQPRPPRAEVERVGQQRLVVGADVEHHRQRPGRIEAADGRVERQLPDGDPHAADTVIAEPEDALAVGHDDDPDRVVAGGVDEELVDAVAVVPA